MSHYSYDRLSALDTSFLILEKPNGYTHVASTQIFEAGPLRTEDGGIDFEAIRKAHASVLHRIPRYRQVLRFVPLESHPVWVDDHHFDLDYHLRHTSLPRPGSDAQLKRLSARIMQQHLDRERPLWETWVVEGLEGDRFALISKVHHCMIDGVSGVDLLQILLSPDPQAQPQPPPQWIPRPVPSGFQLLRDEVVRRARMPFDAVGDFRSFLRNAEDVGRELRVRARAVRETLGETLHNASDTPINGRIGPHRRFDWFAVEIADVRRIRDAFGGSLNDVVLAIATGAFRRFLGERGVDVSHLDFRVLAPVSVRSESERGALGNRVSAWVLPLPLALRDPRAQLAAISSRTAELKESKRAVGAEVLTRVAEWTPTTLLSLGARNSSRLLPFNSVITNVPGPRIPMYLLGARLCEAYPHVPLVDHMGLGIALLSCEGRLHWGINADYDLVPDLTDFVAALQASFAELCSLAAESAQSRRGARADAQRGDSA
ncbi:MAG TPA: wax ester/triacylglycerol synthase family O-acyltransferase [Myxococcota bacterium]|nr:wax ester/triacylglycerol synthase family O-acyltransferase [Myxococcota bacterium]